MELLYKNYHSIRNQLSLTFILLLFTTLSYAATISWDGGGATNLWSEAANWSGDQVPTINDDVVIGDPNNFFEVIIDLPDAQAASLKVSFAIIQIVQSAKLTVNASTSSASLMGAVELQNLEGCNIEGELTILNAKNTGMYVNSAVVDITSTGKLTIEDFASLGVGHAWQLVQGTSSNLGIIIINGTTGNSNAKGILIDDDSTLRNYNSITVSNVDGMELNTGNSSYLEGNGSIVGDVMNGAGSTQSGYIAPWTSFDNYQGIIFIDGDLQQTANGVFQVDIAGNDGAGTEMGHDQLSVTGDIALDGTLDVTLKGGFTPGTSDSYTIMTYTGSLTGTFATVTLPSPAMDDWEVDYSTPGEIVLKNNSCTNAINNWTGTAGDNKWETDGNWSLGHAPLACEDVTITGSPTLSISSSTTVSSINVGSASLTINSGVTVTVDPSNSTYTFANTINVANNGSLTNNGTLLVNNAKQRGISIDGTSASFYNVGSTSITHYGVDGSDNRFGLHVYNSGSFTNTGQLTITSNTSANNTDGLLSGNSCSISNSGSITIENIAGNNSEGISNFGTLLNNVGATIAITGVANSSGILNNASNTSMVNNGNISTSNVSGVFYALLNSAGAVYAGTGSFTGESFRNGYNNMPAILSPGNSPGVTTMTGDYKQTSLGSYAAEIAGNDGAGAAAGHDQVAITGDVTLGGTLDVSLLNGFTPGTSDSYTIMTYTGSLTGTFATVNLPSPAMDDWEVDYSTAGEIVLQNSACTHPDFDALEAFYISTNGDSWTENTGWLTDCDPCNWLGVTCNGAGRVTEIVLKDKGLTGTLPTEIGDLSELIKLDLSDFLTTEDYGNEIGGSIPTSIGNLSNLTELNLGANDFANSIPVELGQLSSLTVLKLGNNELSGDIPTELGDLSALTTLLLEQNALTGSIPSSFGSLTNLSLLYLNNNQLSGCYDPTLKTGSSVLCNFTNADMSDGNSFDAPWEDFCASDAGACGLCATNFWLGTAGDGKWETDANWSLGHAPLACEEVLITGMTSQAVTISSTDAVALSIEVTNANSLTISSGAKLTIDATGSTFFYTVSIQSSGQINVEGILSVSNTPKYGIFINSGTLLNMGNVQISNYAISNLGFGIYFLNLAQLNNSGSITIASNSDRSNSSGIAIENGTVTNSGSISIQNIAGSSSNGIINISTLINEASGTISIDGVAESRGIDNLNTGIVTNNGTISISNVSTGIEFRNLTGSTYAGMGSISGENIKNFALLSPGNSPGVTTITGDYEQGSTGNYKAEIAGDNGAGDAMGHDQIAVTGDVTLGGTLDVNLLGGFVPDNTKTYTIMTYTGTLTGTFETVNNLPAGWVVDYGVNTPGEIKIGPSALLPVEFIDFTVRAENKKRIVHCLWSTAQEINNELFIVERSKDGKNFEEIGNKKGAGTSLTVNTYSFEDRNPLPGINYYRIRQVDYDKKMSFSEIKSTYLDDRSKISFYPNPVSDLIQIENSTSLPITNYRIYNALGQLIENGVMNVEKMDIKHLAAGVYHIELLNSTTTLGNIRIIKK